MEKPEITTIPVDNFNVWQKSEDPNFTQLSHASNIPSHWLSYQSIVSGPNRDSIIKPINLYVQRLVPPPKLISIIDNTVRLRQGNHAEIFLLEDEGSLYNVDRPWQRQYYNTKSRADSAPEKCFPETYKLYVPWFIDENVTVSFESPEVESPITIYPETGRYYSVPLHVLNVEPKFVTFHFNRTGSHMVSEVFGKIPRQSPMFDMVFTATDIMIDRIKEFYEKEKAADN